MMVQEYPLAPTPMPPSINTGSQSRGRDEETEENMYSEAFNAPSQQQQQHTDATDENAFSDAQQAGSVAPAPAAAAAPSASEAEGDPEALNATSRPAKPAVGGPPSSLDSPSFRVEDVDEGEEVHASASQGFAEAGEEVVAPPVPQSRGPGHTPRGARPDSTRPPQRPPSRTSSRFATPRGTHGHPSTYANGDRAHSLIPETYGPGAAAKTRPSLAQSDRSIAFQVEDEASSAASLSFAVEPSAVNRRKSEMSADPGTLTDGSDIHFRVVPESQASRPANMSVDPATTTDGSDIHFEMEQSRGSRPPAQRNREATTSLTSLQFEIESTADHTRHSSISHFEVENDEPQPQPVEELLSESEERRRAKQAEEERRKKALADRAKYMNVRPWDNNAPVGPRRRSSSQAAAHTRATQEAEKRDAAARRHSDMNARPWRTNMAKSPKKAAPAEAAPKDTRPWRTNMAKSPKKAAPVEAAPKDTRPWRHGMSTTPRKSSTADGDSHVARPAAPSSPSSSSSSSSPAVSVAPSQQREERRVATPPPPPKPVFDTEEAAKFITPPPVLKAPLHVLGEEVDGWSQVVSQQRNLQAILEEMRSRERHCARLSSQIEAQEKTVERLNKELYATRDAFVRRYGTDVTGRPLRAPREEATAEEEEAAATAAAAAANKTAEEYTVMRLYPRPDHPATDYIALKRQSGRGPAVSVLSDDDMSDGEREECAEELASWRAERRALRKERAQLARERRELAFQTRRGSNIKDIKLTQPTSGRAPLERRALGTETKVDVDGYDRLMDLRIAAQKADVEAAKARDAYETLSAMAVTMRKQHRDDSRELTDAQEMQEEGKERYEKILRELRQRVEAARPLVDKAQAFLRQRERAAQRSDDPEDTEAELREYGDSILAVRLQLDRAAAMAEATGADEERMRRASTPRMGLSRTATPRGSISVSARPRANSASHNDDVFARLTGRKSVDLHNAPPQPQLSAPVAWPAPPKTPVQATPVAGTPRPQTPVQATPVAGTPRPQTPVQATPVAGTPRPQTPVAEAPTPHAAAEATPTEDAPVHMTLTETSPVHMTLSGSATHEATPKEEATAAA